MRYFSYAFHTLLALFLIGISAVAMSAGATLRLGMLPWSGDMLSYIVLCGAVVGLGTVLLALKGTLRILFLIWSFLVFVLMVKGYIFSRYQFSPNEFRIALYRIGASLLSLLGAWFQLTATPRPKKF